VPERLIHQAGRAPEQNMSAVCALSI